jgi:hypothetical protein
MVSLSYLKKKSLNDSNEVRELFVASRTLELINYARVARVRVVRVVTEVFSTK